jgi:cytochrome P450
MFDLWSLLGAFAIVATVLAFLGVLIFQKLRYGEQETDKDSSSSAGGFNLRAWLVFYPLAYFSGQKKVVVLNSEKDSDLIEKVLRTSIVKGKGIENWFAFFAWKPVYNIESVDGDKWRATTSYLHDILKSVDYAQVHRDAERTGKDLVDRIRLGKQTVVDSREISLLPARVYHKLLFGTELPAAEEDLFYAASNEWRKEVALKGKGDQKLKHQLLENIVAKIASCGKYDSKVVETAQKHDALLLTAFMQPFFISPMINFSDIFTALFDLLNKNERELKRIRAALHGESSEIAEKLIEAAIFETIRLRHPFPVLERELTRKIVLPDHRTYEVGTQFFIELDCYKQSPVFNMDQWLNGAPASIAWMPFGVGPRMCMGKILALKTLIPLASELLAAHDIADRIKPKQGHAYSGRDNDDAAGFSETVYALSTLGKTFIRIGMWRLGLVRYD